MTAFDILVPLIALASAGAGVLAIRSRAPMLYGVSRAHHPAE